MTARGLFHSETYHHRQHEDYAKVKRIIITGATGMIALALIRYHLKFENDCEIFCVIRPDSKRIGDIPPSASIHIIACDLTDLGRLPSLIHSPCDIFYHFAWEGTSGSRRNDVHQQIRNIENTLSAVDAAHALGCSCFIGVGSQAEYGRTNDVLTTLTPANPDTAYGIAKYSAGLLSRIQCSHWGMRYIWARILSIYGPHDDENSMIISCIRSLYKNEKMSFTKSEQMWDYLHCDDAARALYLMAEKGVDGSVYPLGSGACRPLSEYILILRDRVSPTWQPCFGERPYDEKQVMHLCADISALSRDTGFLPGISFEEGIQSTAAWVKEKWTREDEGSR
jgi:UDP-glucose 4-epimerase